MQKLPFKMIIETEMEKYRAETFWTKEPETIEWIKSFKGHSLFYDIGANIGIYSLFAYKIHQNLGVVAFEPMEANFNALMRNIRKNRFKTFEGLPILAFSAWPWAVGIKKKNGYFNSFGKNAGDSGGQISKKGEKIFIISIDWFCNFFSPPNYIKIDIDGQEWKVVQGMKKTLKNPELKSVLIEINENRDEIISTFLNNGFTTDNPFNKMENHSRVRRAREGIKAENIIFTRK
jgi:FkbM family methyltransferase